jgi:hypothetical protein
MTNKPPSVFYGRICPGYDPQKALNAIIEAGGVPISASRRIMDVSGNRSHYIQQTETILMDWIYGEDTSRIVTSIIPRLDSTVVEALTIELQTPVRGLSAYDLVVTGFETFVIIQKSSPGPVSSLGQ